MATLEPVAVAYMNEGGRPPARPREGSSIKAKVSDAFFYSRPAPQGPARRRMLEEEVRVARRTAARLFGRAEVVIR
ncbi:MAG: hypothetical protein U0183_10735 [Polyangiaceae bacterium]